MRGITKVALGFAAATLSLSAGGAIANAQEVPTPPSPTTHTVVHHEPLALAGTIEQHIQNHPTVPAGEILDFLSQSLTLIGRDVLTNTGSNTAHPAQKSDGTTTDGSNEDILGEITTAATGTLVGALTGGTAGGLLSLPGALIGGGTGSLAGIVIGKIGGGLTGTAIGTVTKTIIDLPLAVPLALAHAVEGGIVGKLALPLTKGGISAVAGALPGVRNAGIAGVLSFIPGLVVNGIFGGLLGKPILIIVKNIADLANATIIPAVTGLQGLLIGNVLGGLLSDGIHFIEGSIVGQAVGAGIALLNDGIAALAGGLIGAGITGLIAASINALIGLFNSWPIGATIGAIGAGVAGIITALLGDGLAIPLRWIGALGGFLTAPIAGIGGLLVPTAIPFAIGVFGSLMASFVMVQVGAIMAIIGLLHITGINIFLLGVAIGFNNLLNGLGLAVLFRVIHGLIGRVLGFLAGAAIGKLLVFAANIGLAQLLGLTARIPGFLLGAAIGKLLVFAANIGLAQLLGLAAAAFAFLPVAGIGKALAAGFGLVVAFIIGHIAGKLAFLPAAIIAPQIIFAIGLLVPLAVGFIGGIAGVGLLHWIARIAGWIVGPMGAMLFGIAGFNIAVAINTVCWFLLLPLLLTPRLGKGLLVLPLALVFALKIAGLAFIITEMFVGLPVAGLVFIGLSVINGLIGAGVFAAVGAVLDLVLNVPFAFITSLLVERLIGATIFGFFGPILGSLIGAVLGSIIGIPGAIIGAIIGAVIGAISGTASGLLFSKGIPYILQTLIPQICAQIGRPELAKDIKNTVIGVLKIVGPILSIAPATSAGALVGFGLGVTAFVISAGVGAVVGAVIGTIIGSVVTAILQGNKKNPATVLAEKLQTTTSVDTPVTVRNNTIQNDYALAT